MNGIAVAVATLFTATTTQAGFIIDDFTDPAMISLPDSADPPRAD